MKTLDSHTRVGFASIPNNMRITKSQLVSIIQETVKKAIKEQRSPFEEPVVADWYADEEEDDYDYSIPLPEEEEEEVPSWVEDEEDYNKWLTQSQGPVRYKAPMYVDLDSAEEEQELARKQRKY